MSESFPIYTAKAPLARGTAPADTPTLTPYLLKNKPNNSVVIVLPGGGYEGLADYEGHDVALWLNTLGISAFVLKYRLASGGYKHPAMLLDAARAIRLVRAKAKEFGIDPNRIGIAGSSAGGHLAATACVHYDHPHSRPTDIPVDAVDSVSARPDLAMLLYSVITLRDPFAHVGSRNNLIGNPPPADLQALLSVDEHITEKTPPTFIFFTADDQAVPVENGFRYAMALRQKKVPLEMHVYESGPHGLALAKDHVARTWTELAALWLKGRGW